VSAALIVKCTFVGNRVHLDTGATVQLNIIKTYFITSALNVDALRKCPMSLNLFFSIPFNTKSPHWKSLNHQINVLYKRAPQHNKTKDLLKKLTTVVIFDGLRTGERNKGHPHDTRSLEIHCSWLVLK
jgi:hypothetical protein